MTPEALDPIATALAISGDYRRYLNSLLPIRDKILQSALRSCIEDTPSLTKGPFLEATPPYAHGRSLEALIHDRVLPVEFARFASADLPLARPLYTHQEAATVKVRAGRNVVVSTGTGSGKTESFLIPIFAHLADEIASQTLGPGVRALLLYPMNALANDQMKRLRRLLAATPEVTFGRYVGDTEQSAKDAVASFGRLNPGEPVLPNELLSRDQMQATPPNILLTNYAMLEYLLLRPKDMDLFEGANGGHWRFLVVDEAHVYDGAKGSELAMLLRRLRGRVGAGSHVTCIATSATVGSDSTPRAVTDFAQNLFGTPFEWSETDPGKQDLVSADRQAIPAGEWGPLPPSAYELLAASPDLTIALEGVAPANVLADGPYGALSRERAMVAARAFLARGVTTPAAVASELGPEWTPDHVTALITVGARACDSTGVALLSSRYHQWVRAAEGAFTCLDPVSPHISLSRREQCRECARPVFELAACTRCGTPYVTGREKQEAGVVRLAPRVSELETRTWLALATDVANGDEDDETFGDAGDEANDAVELCSRCGALSPQGSSVCVSCKAGDLRSCRKVDSIGRSLRGCVVCGSRSAGQVRLLDTGQDASAAVVATSLYQRLPEAADASSALPGGGRKILIFSDSRQGAAFFAPYLENSYRRLLQRRLLLRAVGIASAKDGGSALLDDVIEEAVDEASAFNLFGKHVSRSAKKRDIGLWLSQELVAMDERQSLEGLRLVALKLDERSDIAALDVWKELGLSGGDGMLLVTELLRTVRRQGAIEFPDGVDPADDSFAPRLGPVFIRENGSGVKILSWNPVKGTNSRLSLVQRILERSGSSTDPREALSGIWRAVSQGEDPLLSSVNDRRNGTLFRVNYLWLRASSVAEGDLAFRCNTCGRFASTNILGTCPAFRCAGTLVEEPIGNAASDPHHYRRLYRDLTPIPLRVEEHTAQWRAAEAADIQNKFVRGEINALSCSTTFELGVDVGDLQAVMLKNVPPRTANYVQRAGRAGRRTSSAALVVTYAQRRSHDLTQFADPEKMIGGLVTPPVIPLGNARIDRRHAHSIALSAFFRHAYLNGGQLWRNAGEFFVPESGAVAPLELLARFLGSELPAVTAQMEAILPASVQREIGLADGLWVGKLLELLEFVRREVSQEISYFDEAREAASAEQKYKLAEQFVRVIRTLRDRDLLGFLGSRNILPKYGFPTDVVELRTATSANKAGARLDLARDLSSAIYEYAPGSQVVAGGFTWTSAGVYRLPKKELVSGEMAICATCGHFAQSLTPLDPTCGECAQTWKPQRYCIPEFGFVADSKPVPSGYTPPKRSWHGATYLLAAGEPRGENQTTEGLDGHPWVREASERAKMVAVSSGPNGAGYVICDWCGRGWPTTEGFPKSHPHAWKNEDCTGPTSRAWLAHQYETDVLSIAMDARPGVSDGHLWSVLYAILEAASEELKIARDDIDGTVAFGKNQVRLVLFDTVPGGAGGALRISEHFDEILRRAKRAVQSCECGEETSCYSCLRGYRNQIRHDLLSRSHALEMLESLKMGT